MARLNVCIYMIINHMNFFSDAVTALIQIKESPRLKYIDVLSYPQ